MSLQIKAIILPTYHITSVYNVNNVKFELTVHILYKDDKVAEVASFSISSNEIQVDPSYLLSE